MTLNRYFHGYDLCIFYSVFVTASIVLLISLFRGLASHSQKEIDKDELTRYHARIGISDLDITSQGELFGKVD
uniref:Uncharacterized protein n=1 Tax=Rhizophagus irregularis (strain DAOM 181602 / DAOM 197198 / MUCL 43194) TaxID=747089 RepID=U9TKZ0_RHIID